MILPSGGVCGGGSVATVLGESGQVGNEAAFSFLNCVPSGSRPP